MRTRGYRTLPIALLAVVLLAAPGARAQARVLTLPDAVARALAANPTLDASRQSLQAARHKVDGSWAGYLPQAIAAVGYKRATANSPAPPWIDLSALSGGTPGTTSPFTNLLSRENGNSYDNLSASLSVNQTIWDFGRTSGSHDAARSLHDAAGADVLATRESVLMSVIQGYYAVLATREVVTAAEEARAQMEQHVRQAQLQVDAGVRQRIDLTRAQSDLASADLSLLRARNALVLARVALDAVLGGDGTADFDVEAPAEAPVPDLDEAAAVARALQHRPELQSLSGKVGAAKAGVAIARSAWFPALQASGGVAWTGYKFDDLPYNWFVGANLTWNLLSGVPAHAATQEARANVRALQATQRAAEVAIRTEVRSAVLALREAQQRMEPAGALMESARQTLALAEGRYAAGAGSIVEVTDASALSIQARAGLIQARYDLQVARARVLKATGEIERFATR